MTDADPRARATHGGTALRDHWERVHGSSPDDQVSWYQVRPSTSVRLVSKAAAGSGARIVDVGGGASRLVDALLDLGFQHVTVLDIADGALEKAQRRLAARASAVGWVRCDVKEWDPGAPFDVWHDRAVFHFLVDAADRDAYRATLRRALRIGGQAVIGTFSSDGPDRCSGLPVVRYEPETLAAELGPDFQVVEGVREEHVTPSGGVQRFQFSRFVRV